MKDIKIMQLALENFKCHKSLKIDFDGRNATIYGDNAAGKTSIYDALMWLLFSKDSHGNGEKNVEIKPLNAVGEVNDVRADRFVQVGQFHAHRHGGQRLHLLSRFVHDPEIKQPQVALQCVPPEGFRRHAGVPEDQLRQAARMAAPEGWFWTLKKPAANLRLASCRYEIVRISTDQSL